MMNRVDKKKNKLAISLGLLTTSDTLDALHNIAAEISLAELRLDMMAEFNIRQLVSESPCPLILTNRPIREGGNFIGDEKDRIVPLIEGIHLGVAHVDIEWDCIDLLASQLTKTKTKIIVSHHNLDGMPSDLQNLHNKLSQSGADIFKLVGKAKTAFDTVQMLQLISKSTFPTIGLAMGNVGLPGRLLCLGISSCYLSYMAMNDEAKTAEGQIALETAINVFNASSINESTIFYGFLSPPNKSEKLLMALNHQFKNQNLNAVCVSIPIGNESLAEVLQAYQQLPLRGYSVALDYQQLAYYVVHILDSSAQASCLVDTIINKDGILIGYWLGHLELQKLAQSQISLWNHRNFGF